MEQQLEFPLAVITNGHVDGHTNACVQENPAIKRAAGRSFKIMIWKKMVHKLLRCRHNLGTQGTGWRAKNGIPMFPSNSSVEVRHNDEILLSKDTLEILQKQTYCMV